RAINFDDTATRQTADAQCDVEAQRSGGDNLDVFDRLTCAEPHDRPFAELLFDLRERGSKRLALFSRQSSRAFLAFFHESSFAMMNGACAGCAQPLPSELKPGGTPVADT